MGAYGGEIFPLFNWSLFTKSTSAIRYEYAIFVEELNGKSLARPTLIYQLKDRLKGWGDPINLRKASGAFATAIRKKDPQRVQAVRAMVESRYLSSAQRMKYSVRLMTYNPLERYHTGKVTPIEVIGRYEK
jgi:hypothetical protein